MERQKVDERYKVDSTKGGSLINPISYKGDVMVQVWMDSRVLATLCKWLESEGEYPRFLSHIVRIPLEMLADNLVEEEKAEMVEDTLVARSLLKGRFHVSLNKGRKGTKNLMHNITLSSRRGTDMGTKIGGIDYTRYSEEEPVEKLGREEVVARHRKEKARKKQELKETVEKEMKKAKEGGLVIEESREEKITKLVEMDSKLEKIRSELPELSREEVVAKAQADQRGEVYIVSEGPTVKEGMTDEEWEAKQSEIAKRDRERLELENAPFDASDLPTVVVSESNK